MRLWAVIALLLLPWADAPAAAPAPPHTFTDQYGRTFAGEIVEVSGAQVKIRRAEDAETFTLDIARLSEADAAFVTQWQKDHEVFRLRVEASTYHSPVRTNSSRDASRLTQNMEMGYEIKLSNDNFAPASGLRFEYNVFVLKSSTAYGALLSSRIKAKGPLDKIAFKQTAVVKTSPLAYNKTSSMSGDANATAELKGLWVRVFSGDRLVAEFLSNEKLRAEGWEEIQPASPPGRWGRPANNPDAGIAPPAAGG
jgi:hypothetical protein